MKSMIINYNVDIYKTDAQKVSIGDAQGHVKGWPRNKYLYIIQHIIHNYTFLSSENGLKR